MWALDLREHDPRDFFRVWKEKCLIGDDYSLQKENAPPSNESESNSKHSVVGSKVQPSGLKSFPVPASLAKRAPSQVFASLLHTWIFNFIICVIYVSISCLFIRIMLFLNLHGNLLLSQLFPLLFSLLFSFLFALLFHSSSHSSSLPFLLTPLPFLFSLLFTPLPSHRPLKVS